MIEGTPAQHAGLFAGDQIISADGALFQPVQSFRGKVGVKVVLALRRAGTVMQVPVTPVDIEPNGMFLDGMKASARIVRANGRRIGYVHVWCYAGYAYQRELERLLSEGPLHDADALIWDLRDGWGGAIPQYLDLFNARAPTMQLTNRSGASEFEDVKWRKPVAMLVNGGTRSGKEVLAYGFRKYRLGEVIGTRTEGAVLAATAFLIGAGLLLLAVEDVLVDGERLEGVGVAPTIEVELAPCPRIAVILSSIGRLQFWPRPEFWGYRVGTVRCQVITGRRPQVVAHANAGSPGAPTRNDQLGPWLSMREIESATRSARASRPFRSVGKARALVFASRRHCGLTTVLCSCYVLNNRIGLAKSRSVKALGWRRLPPSSMLTWMPFTHRLSNCSTRHCAASLSRSVAVSCLLHLTKPRPLASAAECRVVGRANSARS